MDKNEQNLKIEELKMAMSSKDYEKAREIADALDLKKIRDNIILSLAADAYEVTHNYQDAKKVLLMAYENTNAGRHLAYRLCLLAIKTKDYDEAEEFYGDFLEIAPRDTGRYILKYKINKAQGAPIEKLISILEEYVNIDMEEKWAYELAKLYHMAGDEEKCIDMCDEISLWFAEGKYVVKAMALKKIHHPLTPSQQEKYNVTKKIKNDEAAKIEAIKVAKKLRPFEMPSDKKEETTEAKPEVTSANKNMEEIISVSKEDNKSEDAKTSKPKLTDNSQPGEESDAVADILRKLQERGILKAETVDKVINIIDDVEEEPESKQQDRPESTDEPIVIPKKNQNGIHLNTIVPPNMNTKSVSDDTAALPKINTLNKVEQPEKIVPKGDVVETLIDNEEPAQKEYSITEEGVTQEENSINGEAPEQTEFAFDEAILGAEEPQADEESSKSEEKPVSAEPEQATPVAGETIMIPNIKEISKQLKADKATEQNKETIITSKKQDEDVPVFDLDFDSPDKDDSINTSQVEIYEDIVANSDLGSSTDQLPTKEEIEDAIKKAEKGERLSAQEDENDVQSTEQETDIKADEESKQQTTQEDDSSQKLSMKEQKEPSAKIEIISGAPIEQPGKKKDKHKKQAETKKAEEEDLKEEVPAEKPELVLTEEELAVFKSYLNVEGLEEKIIETIRDLIVNYNPNGKSETGNVIIMGGEKTGKTTLAIELAKLVNAKRGRRNRRLAKVSANALNRKGFRNSLNKLVGSDLIVENAELLGAMTLSEVVDVSGMYTDDMLIVLEGETEKMEQMIKEYPRLLTAFNHVITIREYDVKEWVAYAKNYAKELGYGVDEIADLALHKAVDDFFGENNGIGEKDIEQIIDNAIKHTKKIGRKFSGIFKSKNIDEDGLILLQESDFEI